MSRARMWIEGAQEAQEANLRAIAQLRPSGSLGSAAQMVGAELLRGSITLTHVETGALKSSHRMMMFLEATRARSEVFIDQAVVNPRGERPAEYGPHEHDRGGSHAFYELAAQVYGEAALSRAEAFLQGRVT